MSAESDISADEAARYWAVPEFREYRANRKFCTNQCNPWPSDAGLIREFEASESGRRWRVRLVDENAKEPAEADSPTTDPT